MRHFKQASSLGGWDGPNKGFLKQPLDISEEYVEYAKRRLENAEKEKARVLKELSLHSIELTFKERKERGF